MRKDRGTKQSNNVSSEEEPIEVSGVVENIVFRSEDTGYTVCQIKTPDSRKLLTVVGTCAAAWVGETMKAVGKWKRHKVHGPQFEAERIVCIEPHSPEGIRKYLASGIMGIGPVYAERLVDKFGEDTLRVIDKESALLLTVEGIGKKRKEEIRRAWQEQKSVRDIMIFLHSHAISPSQAMRIYKRYGDDSVAVVKKNPYQLASDVWGIGFKSADRIALSMGIPKDSPIRARAGILYVLETMSDEGHCFCPREELVDTAESLLEIPPDKLESAIDVEIHQGAIVKDQSRLYLAALYHAETGITSSMHRLAKAPPAFKPIALEKAIPWAEKRMHIDFANCQKQALKTTLSSKISIITGGPGVGKTTIVRALVDIFRRRNLKVMLAAPTGRAAKRLEEATRQRAATIHRLLHFQPATRTFEFNSTNPLDCDIIILDEVSMVDVSLANTFLRALPDHACLVLVGDADQLPSVGPGNFLRDVIESDSVNCVKLDQIFRQSERSWIVHNAHLVNRGRFLELNRKEASSDFYFIESADPDDVIAKTVELITERIPRKFHMSPMTDIQLLTPMRRFQLGAENLNAVLQGKLNPTGPQISRYGRVFRMGDRVMQVRNNYDKNVFNGDIGRVKRIDHDNEKVVVDFDGNVVDHEFDDLDELNLAYASSIHKAQGSEYPAVVLLLTTQHYRMLQRNLLYTAITRGRRLVCLVGSRKATELAIRNNRTIARRTGLRERLVMCRTVDFEAF